MIYGDDPDNKFPLISAITQSTNLYVYCANNPLIYVDPDGEIIWITAGIGALIGGAVGLYHGYQQNGNWSLDTWKHTGIGALGGAVVGAGLGFLLTPNVAVAGAAAAPYLKQVSDAANAAANGISEFTVKAKHLAGAFGTYSKFKTDSLMQVQTWVQNALQSSKALFMPDPKYADRIQIFVDMGREIGTRGQHIIKIVIDEAGKIITAYPVRSIP